MDGQRFRAAIKEIGYNSVEFSQLMDVSTKTVSLWANNKSPVPRSVQLYIELRLHNLTVAANLTQQT